MSADPLDQARQMWADDPASRALGMELVSLGAGHSVVSMTVRADMVNGYGLCHGGLVASLADSAFAFACKGGVCGTCRARVTAGEVDMRRNYALEAAEVEAGFVLTCQSHPVGDAVTVDFDA